MWLELLKSVDGYEAGKFLEVAEDVGRSYIAAGLAKDGGDGPEVVMLQRSLATFRDELRGVTEAMAAEFREAAESIKKTPVIRSGSGLEFGSISAGESEADRTKGFGDFMRCVVRSLTGSLGNDIDAMRTNHERLTKVYGVSKTGDLDGVGRAMTEGAGSSLGYTTPVIYEAMIQKEAAEANVILRGARRVPLGARETYYPALDQYRVPAKGQSAMFGGVQVYRRGEITQRTGSDVNTKQIKLVAQDLTAYMEVSRDSLADSSAPLDSMLPQLAGEAIGWRTDWEALNGTGSGQLFGLFNHPAVLQVTRALAGHVGYADVFPMYTKLLPSAKRSAAWYVHPFSMADIMTLKDESGRNVYLPVIPGSLSGPIAQLATGTLLGLPIVESEKCSTPGTPGDVNLFSMDSYLYGERGGLEIGLSEHFRFDTDELAIKLKLRNDGKPRQIKPIYLADGSQSNKVSAFVSLS